MADDVVDVLIVGAGASGAAVAWSLAETRMRIVCLEQGGWMNPAEYPSNGRDWEMRQAREFQTSPNLRKRPADYPINDDDSPIAILNFNAVGGSTILYSAHFPRFHPSDFKVKTLDGVADDWPIDYATLEPYFAENDQNVGVAGLAGDPAIPAHQPPLPHIPMGRMGETMGHGFNKLGWHWWPSDSAIATREHNGRGKCLNLGPCNAGCAQGAKSSADVTYWPMAERAGVELRTHCRVREITVNERDMATGVAYYDADGVERHQRAEVVIVACNGVGTPRLLLNSTSARFPDGLANRSGLVGKNLMLHPWGYVQGIFDEPLASHFGPQGCCILSQEFYETDTSRGFVRGYNMQITRGGGPVATARGGMASGAIPWGADHHAAFERVYDRNVHLGICCEDLPEAHNCVTLDAELKDSHGIPAPKVSYTLSENSRRMLDHGLEKGAEAMRAAGAAAVQRSTSPMRYAGWHLLGTARMGDDPERSVVNGWGRSHDVRNLFVVDGSVFVTSGGVNPTTTIQAVALYIADSMKRTSPICLIERHCEGGQGGNVAEDLIGSDNPLSATQRRTLNSVLDLIVPASADGAKPSAAEVGVLDYIRDHEAATLPALANEIDRLEDEAQEQHGVAFADLDAASRQALVDAMRAADRALFRTLALQTVTCYYQDERVLEAIGLEARPPFPKGYEVPAGDLTLLEPVRRRGSRVREA